MSKEKSSYHILNRIGLRVQVQGDIRIRAWLAVSSPNAVLESNVRKGIVVK